MIHDNFCPVPSMDTAAEQYEFCLICKALELKQRNERERVIMRLCDMWEKELRGDLVPKPSLLLDLIVNAVRDEQPDVSVNT